MLACAVTEKRRIGTECPKASGGQTESRVFMQNLPDVRGEVARLGDVSGRFYSFRDFRIGERAFRTLADTVGEPDGGTSFLYRADFQHTFSSRGTSNGLPAQGPSHF